MTSDRFSFIPAGRLPSPAKCWVCGAAHRDCLDWGGDIQFVGAILICRTCFAEAATLLDAPVDFEKEELKKRVKELEDVISGIVDAVDGVFADANVRVIAGRVGEVLRDPSAYEFLAKAGR